MQYTTRGGLNQALPGTGGTARLRRGGPLVMAAGALATPRLLLLSGVGPRGLEAEIFPGQSPAPFAIDNALVGVGVFDHVMTMVSYNYDGPVPYQSYNYGDYTGHTADLKRYLDGGRGSYAQYQPVSILNYGLGSDIPNIEIFLNPNGAGTPGGPYYGANTLSAFLMLLNPKARGLITLDDKGNVQYPSIYLPNTPDGAADTALMAEAVFNMIKLLAQDPGLKIVFGPGGASHPHLRPDNLADIREYVTGPSPVDGVHFNRLIINHYGGTAALSDGAGGVDPKTLLAPWHRQRGGGRCIADSDHRAGSSSRHDHGGRGSRRRHPGGALDLTARTFEKPSWIQNIPQESRNLRARIIDQGPNRRRPWQSQSCVM